MLMDVCNKEFLTKQPISIKTTDIVMNIYHIPKIEKSKYTLNLLIPVNLGGSSEVKNVWPMLINTRWSPYRKLILEDTLNWMVCNAKMTLGDAKYIIKKDWIKAYKYYILKDTTIIIEVK